MEKLGAPQTHVALRQMIAEVDEDGDKAISFREVFLSKQETLMSNSVLCQTELCYNSIKMVLLIKTTILTSYLVIAHFSAKFYFNTP